MTQNQGRIAWIVVDIISAAIPPLWLAPFFIGHACLTAYLLFKTPSDRGTDAVDMTLLGVGSMCALMRLLCNV